MGHLAAESIWQLAIAASQQSSRRYAKRQMTWFRNQLPGANFISFDRRLRDIIGKNIAGNLFGYSQEPLTG